MPPSPMSDDRCWVPRGAAAQAGEEPCHVGGDAEEIDESLASAVPAERGRRRRPHVVTLIAIERGVGEGNGRRSSQRVLEWSRRMALMQLFWCGCG